MPKGVSKEIYKSIPYPIFTTDSLDRSYTANEIEKYKNKTVLLILKPRQLNILGQVFRPVICATVSEVSNQYVEVRDVNIKMSNAPEFIFPTPLIIPLVQVVTFLPFDRETRFPLY
ncbi:hypothetical protein [Caldanaerobius polysaccharolyticus]|uniref:hypothetical protein n=1 Tax=Caldanaerobius polysaccharolyticus TaxID=44256 RepID=UPI00068DA501|nr:hypothetical protein [Caldanaerobius polysaccharolyticus]